MLAYKPAMVIENAARTPLLGVRCMFKRGGGPLRNRLFRLRRGGGWAQFPRLGRPGATEFGVLAAGGRWDDGGGAFTDAALQFCKGPDQRVTRRQKSGYGA
jgi:hypothetical protein